MKKTGLAMNLMPTSIEAMRPVVYPAKWDEDMDYIIIGSGLAGFAAAIEIGRNGKSVTIIEKNETIGGNSIINSGDICVWDDMLQLRQKLNMGEDSAELHYKDMLEAGSDYNTLELARAVAEGAPDALNLLISEGGLELRQLVFREGGYSAYRGRTSLNGTGKDYIDAQKRISSKYDINERLATKVTRIWRRDPVSSIDGIQVETKNGVSNIKVNCALILATGGFANDVKMRQMLKPSVTPSFNSTNQPNATGEMIRYAQAVGADVIQLSFIQLFPFANPDTGRLDPAALINCRLPGVGGVFVDVEGRRFVNELARWDVVSRAETKTGADRTFGIFNEDMVGYVTAKKELDNAIKKGRAFKADSLTKLAAKAKIPAKTLENTIAEHNKMIVARKDNQFNKIISKYMLEINNGPYYLIAQWPAVHYCMGGVRINANAAVLDIWDDPIPKLYAAGEVTGGVHGANRLGANATSDCLVFGKIAGASAVRDSGN